MLQMLVSIIAALAAKDNVAMDTLQHGIYEKEMPLRDILKAESLFFTMWKLDLNDEFGDDP